MSLRVQYNCTVAHSVAMAAIVVSYDLNLFLRRRRIMPTWDFLFACLY